jgi:hypothetical protein
MFSDVVFEPEKKKGILFHSIAIILLLLFSLFFLSQLIDSTTTLHFFFYLIPALVCIILALLIANRLYVLRTITYLINRDSIQITWGIRYEQISIGSILWIELNSDLANPIQTPRYYIPGLLIGSYDLAENQKIEFIASDESKLVLIATSDRIFVISPAKPEEFLMTFQKITELGSLSQSVSQSIYPSHPFHQVWSNSLTRILMIVNLVLIIGLVILVSLLITANNFLPLGFLSYGSHAEIVPSKRLLLLLIINSSFFVVNLLLGIFFFQDKKTRIYSFLLYFSNVFTSIIFLLSILFIWGAL